jgi:hypothetical protein
MLFHLLFGFILVGLTQTHFIVIRSILHFEQDGLCETERPVTTVSACKPRLRERYGGSLLFSTIALIEKHIQPPKTN